jgi:ATP-dependent protease ClpP protease subunit
VLFFCVMQLAYGTASRAAQIIEKTSLNCAVTLTGEIAVDDIENLKTIATKMKLDDRMGDGELENSSDEAICLNSLGGSYLEGRKIALFVHDNAIPTRIENGSLCYSACAVIFMAGRLRGPESDNPARYLNAHGKLGFHAPYWTFDDNSQFSGREVKLLTELQSKLFSDFIQFGSFSSDFSFKPDVPISLLVDMYKAAPDQMALVDTVEKVARWGIELEGIRYKSEFKKKSAAQLCVNFQAWSKDETSVSADFATDVQNLVDQKTKTEVFDIEGKKSRFLFIDLGGLAARYCLVEIKTGLTDWQQICLKDDFSGRHLGDCSENAGFQVPSYFSLPPSTLITEVD